MDGHADATEQVAIAKLEPTLPNLQSCYFKAVLTLIWPYSSSNKTLSVLLAEPDFLLRRSRGQVKVQFAGSSAKHVFDAGIGSGDELVVSLNGAEWIPESASTAQTPGRGIEWELKFAERLVLQIRQRESGNIALLNLDNPPQELEPVRVAEIEAPLENPSPPPGSPIPTARHDQLRSEETGEWSSPAFIKRARLSYGSFIGKDFEAFIEDDGAIPGKGRKRSRFGRKSGDWRYISRSPSPEEEVEVEEPVVEEPAPEKEKPTMTDEGCQTDGLEFSDEMQEFFRQSQAAGREARPPATPRAPPTPSLRDNREFTEYEGGRQQIPLFDSFPQGHAQPASQAMETNGATAQWPESIFRDMGFSNGSLPDMNLRPNLPFEQPTSHSPQIPPTTSGFENYQEERNGLFQASYPPDQPVHHGLPLETDVHYGEHLNEAPEEDRDSTASQFAHPTQSLYPELPDVSMETPAQPAWESLTHVPGEAAPSTLEIPNAPSREESAPRYSQPSTPKYRLDEFNQVVETNESEEESGEESEEGEEDVDRRQTASDEEMEDEESGEEIEIGSRQAPGQYYDQRQFPDEQGGTAGEQRYRNERGEIESGEEDQPSEEQEFSDDDEGSELESDEEALYAQEGEEFDEGEDFDENDEERYEDEEMSEEDLGPIHQQQQQPAAKAEPVFIDLLSSDDEEEQPEPEPKPPLVHKDSSFADVEDNVQDNVREDEEIDEDAEAEFYEESEEEEMAVGLPNGEESEESEESEGSEAEGPELEDEEPSEATEVWQPGTPQATEVHNEVEMQEAPAVTLLDQPKSDNANLSMVEEVGGYEDEDDTMERGLAEQRFMDGANDLPSESRTAKKKTPTPPAVEDIQVDAGEEEEAESRISQPEPVEMEVDHEVQETEAATVRQSLDEQLQAEQLDDEQLQDEHLEEEQLEEEQLEEELKQKEKSPAEVREDTSLAEVAYPSLPKDESSAIETQTALLDEPEQEDADDSDELINAQLMTPDATQITSTASQGASFAASTEKQLQNNVTADKVVTDEVVHSSVEDTEPIKETHVEVTKRVTRSAKTTTDTLQPPVTPTTDKKMSLRSATSPVSARTDRSPSVAAGAPSTRKGRDITPHLAPKALSPADKILPPPPQTPKHNLRSKPSTSPIGARITRSQDRAEIPTTPKAQAATLPTATKDTNAKQLPSTPEKPPLQPLSETALRASLTKALRTNLSDFTPLKVLRHNLGKRLDVLAIATTAPPEAQRAKHGPRHYHLRFNVTDPSIAPTGVVEIQVFRPYKEALPDVEVGDGVLLRNFSVKAEKDKGFALRSEDSSSWAVFKRDRVTECRGPPVEMGEGEEEYVARLKEWWGSRGEEFMARLGRVGESPASAKGKSRLRGA